MSEGVSANHGKFADRLVMEIQHPSLSPDSYGKKNF